MTPSVAERTGVPRGAKMSMPSWRRLPPRSACQLSRSARRSTPSTGIASVCGAGSDARRAAYRTISRYGLASAMTTVRKIARRRLRIRVFTGVREAKLHGRDLQAAAKVRASRHPAGLGPFGCAL